MMLFSRCAYMRGGNYENGDYSNVLHRNDELEDNSVAGLKAIIKTLVKNKIILDKQTR